MDPSTQKELRRLPAVDRLLARPDIQNLLEEVGRRLTVEAVQTVLKEARELILSGQLCPEEADLARQISSRARELARPSLYPVINATGVIIHTNLGRAPLSQAAERAMREASAYCNLEYDLGAGERGSRYEHAEDLLCRLTGAEAALVVNNDAGAVLLALSALAAGREVILSRGQLVEIGGGFRVPDVMSQSGAILVEVGTTNRTYIQDYQRAIGPQTAMLLRVHCSNFRVIGFVHEVPLADMVNLAHSQGLLVVDDLGSGALLDTADFGLNHEPTVLESLASGADLVCFSGDKLLGGPQAGVILGKQGLVSTLRRHPLTRALRVSKAILAGLQATLLHYLKAEATEQIPVWRMIATPKQALEQRARSLAEWLRNAGLQAEVRDGLSAVGGGSLPGETMPTTVVAMDVPSPQDAAERLRTGVPPVVTRIEHDSLLIDLRTVSEQDEPALRQALKAAL